MPEVANFNTPAASVIVQSPKSTVVTVTVPVMFTLPVPVMSLEFKSKSPPNCGVVSSTTSLAATVPQEVAVPFVVRYLPELPV